MSPELEIAVERMLELEDIGMESDPAPDAVRSACDSLAHELLEGYFHGVISWSKGDAIANHLFNLMIHHCGDHVPDFAWNVFLAFDEGEIAGNGEAYTMARVKEIRLKYDAV